MEKISDSLKFEIICRMLRGDKISDLIVSLDSEHCQSVQKFVWEKTLEFGIRAKGQRFSQEELLAHLKAISVQTGDRTCRVRFRTLSDLRIELNEEKLSKADIQEQVDLMCKVANQFIEVQMN